MRQQFDNTLMSSFVLWLDNKFVADGEGYSNQASLLYKQNDPSAGIPNTYASPYKGWVYDSCATGATIPSGMLTQSGNFLTRESGLFFDFQNGRVLSSGNWGPALSGEYARKEYNVYYSTEEETSFYLESVYKANNDLSYAPTGALPYKFAAPCVIITNSYGENKPFSFGGQDISARTARVYVISNNNFAQENINSLLLDSARSYFPLVTNADTPLTAYNDVKSGYYNYCDLKERYGCRDVFVSNVYSYKISDKANKTSNLLLSFFEVDLEVVRYPRA